VPAVGTADADLAVHDVTPIAGMIGIFEMF
jgi:hypothetical protein